VPKHPCSTPRRTDPLLDTVKQTCPDYHVFVQYGRELLLDDFLLELERHCDNMTSQLYIASAADRSAEQTSPVIESRAFEHLPIPAFIKEIISAMDDLANDHKRAMIRWRLRDDYQIDVRPIAGHTWLEDGLALLQQAAQVSWAILRRHWEHLEVCNTDAYRLRCLGVYAAEERRNSLQPLYSHVCSWCGQLLGENVGSDVFCGEAMQVRGSQCSSTAQPPFLLLWSGDLIAQMLPYVFAWDPRTKCLTWKAEDKKTSTPPWIFKHAKRRESDHCLQNVFRVCEAIQKRKEADA
jgi:hypothetical protein